MSIQQPFREDEFISIRREFIMKVDGGRPILYPIDFDSTPIHYLSPEEGLALSLLRGDRTFGETQRFFRRLFPACGEQVFPGLIEEADEMVRAQPTPSGIGRQGILLRSDEPVYDGQVFDPREFVVSPAEFAERAADPKRRLRLDTPIHIFTIFTHRCFTRCVYCYAEREPVKEMPLARWREIIGEMERLGIVLSSPDNGDTFARPDGIDFLESLLEHNMHFLLSTKGHLSRETVARLMAAGFNKPVRGRHSASSATECRHGRRRLGRAHFERGQSAHRPDDGDGREFPCFRHHAEGQGRDHRLELRPAEGDCRPLLPDWSTAFPLRAPIAAASIATRTIFSLTRNISRC